MWARSSAGRRRSDGVGFFIVGAMLCLSQRVLGHSTFLCEGHIYMNSEGGQIEVEPVTKACKLRALVNATISNSCGGRPCNVESHSQ